MSRRNLIIAAVTAVAFRQSGAQSIRVADSLLSAGALDRAESTYYAAARVRPRDPVARWSLGRYLVSRGAPRVGATLLEEALLFGGDPSLITADLAPVYLSLGMYHELAVLPSSSVSSADRERARWLDAHPTRIVAADSVLTVGYKRSVGSGDLGRITIQVNGRAVDAAISARVQGIVISDSSAAARKLHRFEGSTRSASRAATVPAAADSISLGRLTFRNFPVATQSLDKNVQAIVGFDVLARFAPTFDPRAERVTLRLAGSVAAPPQNADVYSTLLTPFDLRILQGGQWISTATPPIAQMLSERRWTLDVRRGRMLVER